MGFESPREHMQRGLSECLRVAARWAADDAAGARPAAAASASAASAASASASAASASASRAAPPPLAAGVAASAPPSQQAWQTSGQRVPKRRSADTPPCLSKTRPRRVISCVP